MILTKLGFKVVGIDLNRIYLKKYSLKWFTLFDLFICDVEKTNLPFKEGCFDYVVFTEVLEHIAIRNPIEILKEIRRVLKPNGVFYLTTPNVSNWNNAISLLFKKNVFWDIEMFYGSLDRHNREYTPDEVKKILINASFKNIKIDFFNSHSNWNSKTPKLFHPFFFLDSN